MLSLEEFKSFDHIFVSRQDKRSYDRERRNKSPIHRAASRGKVDDLESYCVLSPEDIDASTVPMRMTAMHYAARNNHADVIAKLHQMGSSAIDAKDVNGWTPMHHAAHKNSLAAVKMLVQLGSRADSIRSYNGHFPVQMTIYHKPPSVLEFLCSLNRQNVDSAWVPFRVTPHGDAFESVVTVHRYGSEMYFVPDLLHVYPTHTTRSHSGISKRCRQLYYSRSLAEVLFFAPCAVEIYNKQRK